MKKKKNKRILPDFSFKNAEGVEYVVVWKEPTNKWNAEGLCDSPELKDPEVWVNPNLKEKRFLSVLIEEVFHAHAFDKNEKTARKLAANLTKLLIKIGFKIKNDPR